MRHVTLVVSLVLISAPAWAQSTYVVGSFGMDLSRFGRFETTGFDAPDRGGEVMSGALRTGMSVGDRWGVELEFARGAELEDETSSGPPILASQGVGFTFSSTTPGLAPTSVTSLLAPSFRQRLEQRHQTIATLGWVRQGLGSRVDIAYLAGLGFWRTTRVTETSFTFPPLPVLPGLPVRLLPTSQTTKATVYGMDPIVGVEAHIGLTDHVKLVPGLRLQGIGDTESNGWMLRAGVGLGWFF
jgi:hypothetical protein